MATCIMNLRLIAMLSSINMFKIFLFSVWFADKHLRAVFHIEILMSSLEPSADIALAACTIFCNWKVGEKTVIRFLTLENALSKISFVTKNSCAYRLSILSLNKQEGRSSLTLDQHNYSIRHKKGFPRGC